jgi:hypothetical protein
MAVSFDQIRQRTAELQEQIKKLQAEAAEQVKPLLQQFVQDNPGVSGIRWNQYTPYFNDGETCTFTVHEPRFQFGGQEEGGDYEDGFFDLPWDYGSEYYADFRAACPDRDLCEKCRSLATELRGMDDALLALFGDHVQVTVTKDGVEAEEYEHD